MSTRKEKATKAQNKRQERNVKPFLADVVQNDIKAKSITPVEQPIAKPAEIAPVSTENTGEQSTFNAEAARVPIPKVDSTNLVSKANKTVTPLNTLTPWEQMLANQRKQYEQDKTDAVKMQKYYALTDALNAIGKMGGAAIGGAIGGDVLGGAPNVGEYKESRGYLDAFERAKQANDRLRALDEKEFTLAYNKVQKDEDRAHQAKLIQDERAYKLEMDKLDKQWQKDMIDYKAKIEQAALENNLELKAKYEKEAAERDQQYFEKRAEINHKYNMEEKALGYQYSKWQANTYNTTPVLFNDGTAMMIPDNFYNSIRYSLINQGMDKDEAGAYIINNPEFVKNYLGKFGINGASMAQQPQSSQQTTTNAVDTTKTENDVPYAIDSAAVANKEKDALRRDVGIHGIPYMKAGGSDFDASKTRGANAKKENNSTSKKKGSKYSQEDLDFMSQFE